MSREEAACKVLQMPITNFALVEYPRVTLAPAGITIIGPREDNTATKDRRIAVQFDDPVLAAVLVKLLDSAHQALAGDRSQARQFIARATALVRAAVEQRAAAND